MTLIRHSPFKAYRTLKKYDKNVFLIIFKAYISSVCTPTKNLHEKKVRKNILSGFFLA